MSHILWIKNVFQSLPDMFSMIELFFFVNKEIMRSQDLICIGVNFKYMFSITTPGKWMQHISLSTSESFYLYHIVNIAGYFTYSIGSFLWCVQTQYTFNMAVFAVISTQISMNVSFSLLEIIITSVQIWWIVKRSNNCNADIGIQCRSGSH